MSQLILVSKSPRRRNILKEYNYKFVSCSVEVSEFFDENLNINEALLAISRSKVQAYFEKEKNNLSINTVLLGCDTLVCMNDVVLGKPKDEEQAFQYLSQLSGSDHQVKTAMSFYDCQTQKWTEHVETSSVTFKQLQESEIKEYISTGEPMDKARAYAIQGLGKELVSHHEGSWHNIVGLPIEAFEQIVHQNDWNFK